MGNENSMCGCYDNDGERQYAESGVFQRPQRQPGHQNGDNNKFKGLDPAKFSQYSYGKSGFEPQGAKGHRNPLSQSPTSQYRNMNTMTSSKKQSYGMGAGPSIGPGQKASQFDEEQQFSNHAYTPEPPRNQKTRVNNFTGPPKVDNFTNGKGRHGEGRLGRGDGTGGSEYKNEASKSSQGSQQMKNNLNRNQQQQRQNKQQQSEQFQPQRYAQNGINDQELYEQQPLRQQRTAPRDEFKASPYNLGQSNQLSPGEKHLRGKSENLEIQQPGRRPNSKRSGSNGERPQNNMGNRGPNDSYHTNQQGYTENSLAQLNPTKNDRGYQSARSNHSYTSGKQGGRQASQGEIKDGMKVVKKRTLHINDYKKFKKMRNVENRYVFGKTLGQGAFGVVRLCMHKGSGKTFAIKIMQKKAIEKQKIYVQLLQNELSILGEKSHPNIIRIVDLMEDHESYYVVSELVRGGELFQRLTKVTSFTESQAADIVHQVMLGLNYMHLQQVTHRDMKPENILLVSQDVENFDIKIADLGFAQKFDKETGLDLVLGTPLYMAPELVKHEKYNEKVDVWSLGIITYQLLSGLTPFDGRNIKKINENICRKNIKFQEPNWLNITSNAKDFILQCLERSQHERPSIAELFEHPWICEIPEIGSQDEEVQLSIQKNLVQYQSCSDFQKIVLSLISGLSATQEELDVLQKEFIRIDKDKSGTLTKWELEEMTSSKLTKMYNINWDEIINECDYNGDGVIDFQEFISACIDRKVLSNQNDLRVAFRILDTNKDNTISIEDFDDLFNSYGGAKMDTELWAGLLLEADTNGDGVIGFDEFQNSMRNLLQNNLKKRRHTQK